MRMLEHLNKLAKMRETVKEEMNHIPRGSYRQNIFRQFYQGLRMESLGKKAKEAKTKEQVFEKALGGVRNSEKDPKFTPEYDREFFKIKL